VNITAFSIRYNRLSLAIVAFLIFAGINAYLNLPKAQDPGFTIRTAVITTRLPGASPERIEQLVTDKIEKKIQEMPELDNVNSESRTGISIINANFKESYTDMRPIFDDLRRKVEDVGRELPDGIQGPIVNDEFGDVFGHVYSLSGDGFSYAELKTVADGVRDRLLKEPEIAKVEIYGAQEEVIFIEYNNARLTELGISPQQLSNNLQAINILSSGGDIIFGRERIILEPTGNFETLEALKRAVIQLPNSNNLIYLGDVTNIYRGYTDPAENLVHTNGEPSLAIGISMREGGDALTFYNGQMGQIAAE